MSRYESSLFIYLFVFGENVLIEILEAYLKFLVDCYCGNNVLLFKHEGKYYILIRSFTKISAILSQKTIKLEIFKT